MGDRLVTAAIAVVGVPLVLVGYIVLGERLVHLLPVRAQSRARPWIWVGPALAFLSFFLVYPTVNTLYLSFYNADSSQPVGLANYVSVLTSPDNLNVLKNNLVWLVFLTLITVVLGLLLAVLFERVRYESVAKALIFIPMAISFVAAGVIWKLMYDYQPPGRPQDGTLNAIVTALGGQPVPWLVNQATNTPALIWVGIWMWTGFALVIISAGLKSIPHEILEAARVDGATEWQVLWLVTAPMLSSTLAVIATTLVIFTLKAFDIVYVLTAGNFGTDIIAHRMYVQMFTDNDFGLASATATVLLLATVPVMLVNIRRFRAQENAS